MKKVLILITLILSLAISTTTFAVVPIDEQGEGPKYITGDLDDSGFVDSDDAIYLLMSTLFPDDYKLNQSADFDKSGDVDSDDAIYLLMYTLFPGDYPLS